MISPDSHASSGSHDSRYAWVLNLSDHLVNRVIDAGIGVLLLVFLSVEDFSSLALAQAAIAPTLLFFVAPESILYRDFLGLTSERFSAIRKFAWFKIVIAIALGFGLSFVSGLRLEYFLWGYCLAVGPQLLGPLKEYLRLSLKLKELQISNLLYKILLLLGVCVILGGLKASFEWIVGWAWGCTILAWGFLRLQCAKLRNDPKRSIFGFSDLKSDWNELTSVLRDFSGWAHIQGVFQGWVQTLDLLTLGWVGAPTRLVGLYAAALKIANFSLVVCVSLGNLFSVKLARTEWGHSGVVKNEKDELGVKSFTFFGIGMGIAAVGTLLAPWVFRALSRGKYSEVDIETLSRLLGIFLLSYAVLGATVIPSTWLTLRGHVQQTVKWIYVPWFLISLGIYYGASLKGVAMGELDPVAWANLPVAMVLYFALWIYTRKRA